MFLEPLQSVRQCARAFPCLMFQRYLQPQQRADLSYHSLRNSGDYLKLKRCIQVLLIYFLLPWKVFKGANRANGQMTPADGDMPETGALVGNKQPYCTGFLFCITKLLKLSRFKPHLYYLTVSVGQKFRYNLLSPLFLVSQAIVKVSARPQWYQEALWENNLLPSSRRLLTKFQFLVVVSLKALASYCLSAMDTLIVQRLPSTPDVQPTPSAVLT